MNKYKSVVCGGTFDHFHKGHEAFLRFAISISHKLIIGLTTKEYIDKNTDKREKEVIEEYNARKASLESFLKKEGYLEKIEIVPIDDISGPKVYNPSCELEAIVVSEQTKKGAEVINKERKKRNLNPLKVIVFPMQKGEDNNIISSTLIRFGVINREGKLYVNPYLMSKTFSITEELRKKLSKPFGEIIKEEDLENKKIDFSKVITVGDVVTFLFNKKKLNQKISVIDFRVQREAKFYSLEDLGFDKEENVLKVVNPPGEITPMLIKTINNVFKKLNSKKRIVILINGEEDLAVLPLILNAPLGFTIFYGQPGKGIVKVYVSEEKKEQTKFLLKSFDKPK